jgi:hypothetical protein
VKPGFIERIKPWLDALQGIMVMAGIIAGGVWFYLQESTKPLIKMDQTVSQRPLSGDSSRILLILDVHVTNQGKMKVNLPVGHLDLTQINPPKGGNLLAQDLQKLTLEPGQSAQALFVSYVIDPSIKTLQIHTSYPMPGGTYYWNLLNAVDIGPEADKKQTMTFTK